MTIPAQSGVFSFAAQDAKVGDGTFTSGNYTWHRHRSPRVELGTQDPVVPFPMEIGGPLNPSGAYKTGPFFAGEVDILPRAQNILGWLLEGTMGYASSVSGAPTAGMSTHYFIQDPTNSFFLPWLAARCFIPGQSAALNFGEEGYDCKITSLRMVIPAAGKLAFRFRILGRKAAYGKNPSWSYSGAFEDHLSVPESGNGHIKINNVEYPFTAVEINWTNNIQIQGERIIGSFFLDDLVPLGGRAITVRVLYKYEHSNLYQKLLTGDVDGVEWDPLPNIENTGAYRAFECEFHSPGKATGTTPYTFGIFANSLSVSQDGNIPLVAGGMVQQSLNLLGLYPDSGEYAALYLKNANNTGYTWPS